MVTFEIPGRPVPKERPRQGRNGHTYTPARTRAAEHAVALLYKGAKHEGPVEIELDFTTDLTVVTVRPLDHGTSKLRGDIDNYVKTVLDGLNGVAYNDDRQVHAVKAVKR